MRINWPLIIAVLLILLKQVYKLYLNHKPDPIDYAKAVAALPMDLSFLIVSLFIKAAMRPTSSADMLMGLMVVYLMVSVFATVLWRVCEKAVTGSLGHHFFWAFPLNAAMTSSTFYFALSFVK
jgi:hypothetical protein